MNCINGVLKKAFSIVLLLSVLSAYSMEFKPSSSDGPTKKLTGPVREDSNIERQKLIKASEVDKNKAKKGCFADFWEKRVVAGYNRIFRRKQKEQVSKKDQSIKLQERPAQNTSSSTSQQASSGGNNSAHRDGQESQNGQPHGTPPPSQMEAGQKLAGRSPEVRIDVAPDSSQVEQDNEEKGKEKDKNETKKGCFARCKQGLINKWNKLSMTQKKSVGYLGVCGLALFNEIYSRDVISVFGFPLALFVGQCAAIIAEDDPYLRKFLGGSSIGIGILLLQKVLRHYNFYYDAYIPASALGFLLWSSVKDLIKMDEDFKKEDSKMKDDVEMKSFSPVDNKEAEPSESTQTN